VEGTEVEADFEELVRGAGDGGLGAAAASG
jgi:hypothetical protein